MMHTHTITGFYTTSCHVAPESAVIRAK